MKIKMVCSRCGSENIVADSASCWNAQEQRWETVNVYDDGHSCGDCNNETEIVQVMEERTELRALDSTAKEPSK